MKWIYILNIEPFSQSITKIICNSLNHPELLFSSGPESIPSEGFIGEGMECMKYRPMNCLTCSFKYDRAYCFLSVSCLVNWHFLLRAFCQFLSLTFTLSLFLSPSLSLPLSLSHTHTHSLSDSLPSFSL